MITTACQLCGSKKLAEIINLGNHPLADTFLSPKMLANAEKSYPLRVLQCTECGYTTLSYVVPATERYQEADYSYTSANSPVAVKHFDALAMDAARRSGLTETDLVVDIGSNDATLLAAFKRHTGCTVVGIEPAHNIAKISIKIGIPTIIDFFSEKIVDQIKKKYGPAKIITATNVFNHITDLNDFMQNIYRLLTDDGLFIFETPYLLHLAEKRAFDTIYLEHVSYFSIKAFRPFFLRYNMYISDFQENDYMGGSIRVYLSKKAAEGDMINAAILREENAGIHNSSTYEQFMRDIHTLKNGLLNSIREAKKNGGKVIGIGAATKGNTLLNYCGIDHTMLEFVTDASPLKVGKFTPGSRIPIRRDEDITPDITHAVILPWNIGDFLKEKLKHLKVQFIVPKINP